jgi:hypothetical protein
MRSELDLWSGNGTLFLSVLVTSSANVDAQAAKSTAIEYRSQAEKRSELCRVAFRKAKSGAAIADRVFKNLADIDYYLCTMDHYMTSDLFGAAFAKLVDLVKIVPDAIPGSAEDLYGLLKRSELEELLEARNIPFTKKILMPGLKRLLEEDDKNPHRAL